MFVITGGGTGIGKALAQALTARGKSVLIIGRRTEPLLEMSSASSLIHYCTADVSTKAGREKVLSHLESTDKLEGLVNNAGVVEPIMPINAIDEASWRHVMATNVEAPLFLTQALQNKLSGGRVLNIGSGAAYFPVAGWAAYCTSKAALSMLTRCWQLESQEIACSSVMPGIIDTDMQALIRHAQYMQPEKIQFFKSLKQNEQLLTPDTVALFLSWLLLDVTKEEFVSKEWDIYTTDHHTHWLVPPHQVPVW